MAGIETIWTPPWVFIELAILIWIYGPHNIKRKLDGILKTPPKIVEEISYEADDNNPAFYALDQEGIALLIRKDPIRDEMVDGKKHTLYNYIFTKDGREFPHPYFDDDWETDSPEANLQKGYVLYRLRTTPEHYRGALERKEAVNQVLQEEINQLRKSRDRMIMEESEKWSEIAKKFRQPFIPYGKKKKEGQYEEEGMGGEPSGPE